uniref:Nuclear pore complex protein Nup88 n=1 Tax=Elaeophora elaphi TaxID=1147741 RepID=A0A0R3RVN8_9BILA
MICRNFPKEIGFDFFFRKMGDQTLKPVAVGVVVLVDLEMNYGIIHASGYGRVLISRNFDKDLVQLSNWLSVEIEPNTGLILTYQRTSCNFVDAGKPQLIDELLPTGTSVSKTGALNLRIQTPVFIGNITFAGAVGLSPHLGRVYLGEILCEKFKASPLTWIHCGVLSVTPSKANFNSFWEARNAGREDYDDPKLGLSVRRCLGRFHALKEKNICILQLFDRYEKDKGFASIHSFDFAHSVREKDLKKASAIQVYVAPQLLYFPEHPVPACYARVVDDGSQDVEVGKVAGKLTILDISATDNSNGTARSDGSVALVDAVKKNDLICDKNCETIDFISRVLAYQSVAKSIKNDDPVLFNDLCAFIAKYRRAVFSYLLFMADDYSVQLKKAFRELQTKVVDTNRRLQLGDSLKTQQEQKRRRAELTKTQLLELDKNTPVYMAIGRIFAKGTIESEIARHEEEIVKAEEKIAAIDHQRKYLEKNLAESEKNIRELVQSRP